MLLWEEASSAGHRRFHCVFIPFFFLIFFVFDLDLFARLNIALIGFPSSDRD